MRGVFVPSMLVRERTKQFHTDAVLCGVSALALGANAPTLLREEALTYPDSSGAKVFGSRARVKAEKMVVANCSAVRDWDSNGTNFGFNPSLGHTAGEFGHNDFYAVAIAACQCAGMDGRSALLGMILIDEIRGRLAEVFSLKTYKIDHVVHGAIASAAVYAGLMGATAEQIESAIGLTVAHYIPWRAIRAGQQLSDSKGASAAISAEVAVLSAKRAMTGFVGPGDIFRNPESLFRRFEPTRGDSPFRLVLAKEGDDFAVMGMHFKIGLYEHQSAGGLQGVIDLLVKYPELRQVDRISRILVTAYEPAFGIIGDPAKRDPRTRQSADHSMLYILSTFLRKAGKILDAGETDSDAVWQKLILMPADYDEQALFDETTRSLMSRMEFAHGGPEYDARYPDGIPTSVQIWLDDGSEFDSGLIMYPAGHARNRTCNLEALLLTKFERLANIGMAKPEEAVEFVGRLKELDVLSADELLDLYLLKIAGC